MQRRSGSHLRDWAAQPGRLPVVLRGARQTGKTWLVNNFQDPAERDVATVNLERDPDLATCFANPDPAATLALLEARLRRPITPGRTILFLDEIQAVPKLLASLRWFAEELPSLHVVAAGSLLDFALADPEFAMPVGRITFGHVEPMTFAEFLIAVGEERLLAAIEQAVPEAPLPTALHEQASQLVRTYVLVGGMPAAVKAWCETRSYVHVAELHRDLLQTMRHDFAKYKRNADTACIDKVFAALPRLVGRKFQPVQVDRDSTGRAIKAAFRLLCLARVATAVRRSAANGIPLGAEVDERYRKVCMLDIGLFATMSGIDAAAVMGAPAERFVNEGQIAEQFVGQELRACRPFNQEPELFTWVREARSSNAEVDYVIQVGTRIVPVEVKAGASGRLRSLHVMADEKRLDVAVRVGPEPLQVIEVATAVPAPRQPSFRLLSVPLYMTAQIPRLAARMGEAVG
ncbi:MAG: ATP-binding protein [Planctomycetes bacterium]|nr:ATP-binding protein [Planctomycetota bacterium]